jgi:pimeloyl-ACP methyl ester carboxylesterase
MLMLGPNIESLKEIHLCSFRFTGFGKSSKVAPAYTPTYYADIVVVIETEIEKCIVAGHSMGGQAAIKLAINHPDKLKNLF